MFYVKEREKKTCKIKHNSEHQGKQYKKSKFVFWLRTFGSLPPQALGKNMKVFLSAFCHIAREFYFSFAAWHRDD